MDAHETRAKALSGLKSKFHTARPWQKKVDLEMNSSSPFTSRNVAESSEEEMEQVEISGKIVQKCLRKLKYSGDLKTERLNTGII